MNIWGHKEWAPTRKIDPIYDMDQMRQRIDQHADQEADMPLTPADIDAIWAEPQPFPAGFEDVGKAGQMFPLRAYLPGARVEAGRAARQATAAAAGVKAVAAVVAAQGKAIAAIAAAVGAQADDEAALLSALGASEQRLLIAIQTVIVDPQVDNDDPDAVAAALRDFLTRETTEPDLPPPPA